MGFAPYPWASYSSHGTGGGGGYTVTKKIAVSSGSKVNISIGSSNISSTDTAGSTIVEDIEAKGGHTNLNIIPGVYSACPGGSGGSGGGYGQWGYNDGQSYSTNGVNVGSGGSNGGNGDGYSGEYGKGQGTTTRAFEEECGTLYAGGGGGANSYFTNYGLIGRGGSGGGGNGEWSTNGLLTGSVKAGDGYANTGGGGGGGNGLDPGLGGSGIVLIRWGY